MFTRPRAITVLRILKSGCLFELTLAWENRASYRPLLVGRT